MNFIDNKSRLEIIREVMEKCISGDKANADAETKYAYLCGCLEAQFLDAINATDEEREYLEQIKKDMKI